MKARVGELPIGTKFVTGATKRLGTVRAQLPSLGASGETRVRFQFKEVDTLVHAGVVVDVVGQPTEAVN